MLYVRRARVQTISAFSCCSKTGVLLSVKPYSHIKAFAAFILIHFVPGLLVEHLC